jgi:hypothetical protein
MSINRRAFRLSRRHLLRGAGAAVGLPFLEAMLPRSARAQSNLTTPDALSGEPKARAIFCYVPNGVNIADWVPTSSGAAYELSPTLVELERFKGDLTVLSGMGHPSSRGGHTGADTWLTGADLERIAGRQYANSVSVDQLMAAHVAQETRIPSLELSANSGTGTAGHSFTLAFDSNGTPLPAENSARRLFERLFVPDSAGSRAATLQRYANKRSVLDAVLDEAADLQRSLGQADRERMDEYLSSVRETERRVERLEQWIDVPKPEVAAQELALWSQSRDAHDRPAWLGVMLELSYLAFTSDITRVITFEWSREAGGVGPGGEDHHALSHHGGDQGMLAGLAEIDRFHIERLGRFLDLLAGTREGDDRMLDHTMIMYGSGMDNGRGGDHSPDNLPLLIAGGDAIGLTHGQHIAFDPEDHPPLANVLLGMLQAMQPEVDQFQDSTGVLTPIFA